MGLPEQPCSHEADGVAHRAGQRGQRVGAKLCLHACWQQVVRQGAVHIPCDGLAECVIWVFQACSSCCCRAAKLHVLYSRALHTPGCLPHTGR